MSIREAPSTKKRVLVVDDERAVVDLVRRVLVTRDYEVETAYDGRSAVAMIEQELYDLVILDFKMPEMSGVEVYHEIEKVNPEQARRVVFITGDVVGPQTTPFLQAIGRPLLVKPFTTRELLAFVEKALC
jgi:DNA-binding response OmpR family regulator